MNSAAYTGKRQRRHVPWALFLTPVLVIAALVAGRFPGASFAVLAFWGLAGLSVLYGFICLMCRHARWGRLARAARHTVHALLALWLLSFVVVEALILSHAGGDPDGPVDCVLVLGAGLTGEIPAYPLASRLDAAVVYLTRHPGTPVVVSGGQGPGESISEAEAMSRYLAGRGIDPARITREDRSASTAQNVAFSLPLFPEGTARVAVVSNEFHLYRARILLRRAGIEPLGVSAPTPMRHLKPVYYFREYFAMVFTWLGIDIDDVPNTLAVW